MKDNRGILWNCLYLVQNIVKIMGKQECDQEKMQELENLMYQNQATVQDAATVDLFWDYVPETD